jgi:hypothetical protein
MEEEKPSGLSGFVTEVLKLLGLVAAATTALTGIAFVIGFVAMDAHERNLGLIRTAPSFVYAREGLGFIPRTMSAVPIAIFATIDDGIELARRRPMIAGLLITGVVAIAVLLTFGSRAWNRMGGKWKWVEATERYRRQWGWTPPLTTAAVVMVIAFEWFMAPFDSSLSELLAIPRIETDFHSWAARKVFRALSKVDLGQRALVEYGQRVAVILVVSILLFVAYKRFTGAEKKVAKELRPSPWSGAMILCSVLLGMMIAQLPSLYGVLALDVPSCVLLPQAPGASVSEIDRTRRLLSDITPDDKMLVLMRKNSRGAYLLEFFVRDSLRAIEATECVDPLITSEK